METQADAGPQAKKSVLHVLPTASLRGQAAGHTSHQIHGPRSFPPQLEPGKPLGNEEVLMDGVNASGRGPQELLTPWRPVRTQLKGKVYELGSRPL